MSAYTPITDLMELPVDELFEWNEVIIDIIARAKKGVSG
jgi:hypothetical protein